MIENYMNSGGHLAGLFTVLCSKIVEDYQTQ